MGLEKVIEEILSAGEEQSRKIVLKAEEEQTKLLTDARAKAESARKDMDMETEQKISLMKQQALSSAELEAKKRVLREHNIMLTQVRQEILKTLSSQDASSQRTLLDKLGKLAAKRISQGVIHCRKKDEASFMPPMGFRKIGDLKAAGGIVAESEDGSYRIDLSFEALLDDLWGKNVREVYNILFGGV